MLHLLRCFLFVTEGVTLQSFITLSRLRNKATCNLTGLLRAIRGMSLARVWIIRIDTQNFAAESSTRPRNSSQTRMIFEVQTMAKRLLRGLLLTIVFGLLNVSAAAANL
jgi:hypothetical protein